MGRAVAMLMDRELYSVFGDITAGESAVFAQQAAEELAIREAKVDNREREVDADEARMRERGERLRRWEDEVEARAQRAELESKVAAQARVTGRKIGRNERCPCGSGVKYKRCHGLVGDHR